MQKHILENLTKLNDWLKYKNKKIILHVIGGFALHLHKIDIGRYTQDIDPVNKISEHDIIEKIHEIGEETGQAQWFDFGASSLQLPNNYEERLIKTIGFENIDIWILSIHDLVILKISAYFQRREQGITRDLEDLLKMNPSINDVDDGLNFIYENAIQSGLPSSFLKELIISLDELKKELLELIR